MESKEIRSLFMRPNAIVTFGIFQVAALDAGAQVVQLSAFTFSARMCQASKTIRADK